MDVPDKWNKTPLHYAAQRGASICQIYLFKRGVNKEAKDIYGNTPLAISILKKHHNSAIIMI
jgi:ankyrin repeat protein